MTSQFKNRTEEKLRYALIHLGELRNYENATSNDAWERAHQESCFFQLAGSVEALLHEINNAYSLGIKLNNVRWNEVDKKLKQNKKSSRAFDYLMQLRNDTNSWLFMLFEWRNQGAHRQNIGKNIHISRHRLENEFLDPRNGQPQNIYPGLGCLSVLEQVANDVRKLINYCREIDYKL